MIRKNRRICRIQELSVFMENRLQPIWLLYYKNEKSQNYLRREKKINICIDFVRFLFQKYRAHRKVESRI